MTLYWSAAGGAENDMTPYTRIIHVREAFGVATILINVYATCVYTQLFSITQTLNPIYLSCHYNTDMHEMYARPSHAISSHLRDSRYRRVGHIVHPRDHRRPL